MTDVFLRALVLLVKIRVATFFSDVNEQNLAILLASWCENCSCHGWTGENEVPCSHGCFSQWPSGKVIRELSDRGDGPASVARTSVGFRGSGVHDASDPSPTRPLQFLAPVRTPLSRTTSAVCAIQVTSAACTQVYSNCHCHRESSCHPFLHRWLPGKGR